MNFRIGHGYDVHRLAAEGSDGKRLVLRLGGVTIPHSLGLVAHSDGDVVVHALCDALLGAAALGDIGIHFPDSDPAYKGIDSLELLRLTTSLLLRQGFVVSNVDCTLELQAPKVASFIPQMRSALSSALNIDPGQVSLKATTTEGLGFVGRQQGVAAHAVVLIKTDERC